jgi:sulfite exporter TauE/SafE
MLTQLLSAFVVGLLGGVHCIGMCGGIVSTLTFGLPKQTRSRLAATVPFQLAYNLGRILSYTLAGALMGGLGFLLAQMLPLYYAQRALYLLAGLFMLALGLYLAGWWPAWANLEQVGGGLWRRLEPLGKRLMPVRSPAQALVLGMIWGWLPCGLVYSVLVWTVSAGGALEGAALMLAFGLGTLPNLLLMGLVAGGILRWTRKAWVRRGAGLMVMGFGLYSLWQVVAPGV